MTEGRTDVVVWSAFGLRRHFDPSAKPSASLGPEWTPTLVLQRILESYRPDALREGYAPFCKHLFIPNFTAAAPSIVPLTPDLPVRTAYKARTPEELPVLTRWVALRDLPPRRPPATWLDIILYSREQMAKEDRADTRDFEWAIVSIKAQDEGRELPMEPITAMRNALGVEHGGSGVPLSRDHYLRSVEFWESHILVIPD